jgi:hypothetical protein
VSRHEPAEASAKGCMGNFVVLPDYVQVQEVASLVVQCSLCNTFNMMGSFVAGRHVFYHSVPAPLHTSWRGRGQWSVSPSHVAPHCGSPAHLLHCWIGTHVDVVLGGILRRAYRTKAWICEGCCGGYSEALQTKAKALWFPSLHSTHSVRIRCTYDHTSHSCVRTQLC